MSEMIASVRRNYEDSKTVLGFWVYLMTDCILFGSLFAAYAVLQGNTFGGPSSHELFELPFVLLETLILLTSSFTMGLAMIALASANKKMVITWLLITFALGLSFLGLELSEFNKFVSEGADWQRSGFLSAFFTLVGTHGAHILVGLIWMGVMIYQVQKHALKKSNIRRLTLLSLFWHFLDVVWIFIFTIVYLMGVI